MAGKAKNIEKEIAELRQQINQHDYSYYVLNSPTVADVEYDALMRRLKDLETEHPEFITPDSPTQRVSGQPSEGFEEYFHKRPMLSLDNSYSVEDLRDWARRCEKLAEGRSYNFVCELKIDGLSLSLIYENGLLARAGEIKQPKRREKLIEFAEQACISRPRVVFSRRNERSASGNSSFHPNDINWS